MKSHVQGMKVGCTKVFWISFNFKEVTIYNNWCIFIFLDCRPETEHRLVRFDTKLKHIIHPYTLQKKTRQYTDRQDTDRHPLPTRYKQIVSHFSRLSIMRTEYPRHLSIHTFMTGSTKNVVN